MSIGMCNTLVKDRKKNFASNQEGMYDKKKGNKRRKITSIISTACVPFLFLLLLHPLIFSTTLSCCLLNLFFLYHSFSEFTHTHIETETNTDFFGHIWQLNAEYGMAQQTITITSHKKINNNNVFPIKFACCLSLVHKIRQNNIHIGGHLKWITWRK